MSERLSLDGQWQLEHCAPGAGESAGMHKPDHRSQDWIGAGVPGDVHIDLVNAGLIKDPLYGRNAEDCYWVENEEWWYRRTFSVSADSSWDRAELWFGGLDTTAAIWLNGVRVGDHNNFFVPYTCDVSGVVREGENVLVVRLDCGLLAAKDDSHRRYFSWPTERMDFKRSWIRKPAYTFQWDWAPRLLTCGIWQNVRLHTYQSLAIRDVFLVSRLRDGRALVSVRIDAESFGTELQQAHFTACLSGDETHGAHLEATLAPGLNMVEMSIAVDNPRLWWPNGSGEPYLYDFALELSDKKQVRDRYTCRHGIREVELIQEPCENGSQSFLFAINGRRVFAKGANWAPADCFPARLDRERYHVLVEAAARANFNMFRVNGVGLYEKDSFFECCDELGVMIWQDFTYSCGHYPDDDADFLREACHEAELTVKRLRNHPCLVLWCGNNECEIVYHEMRESGEVDRPLYGREIYHRVLPRACSCFDGTRPYWPSSPYGGEDPASPRIGNNHPWRFSFAADEEGYRWYAKETSKFASELGFLSPPVKGSLERFLPPDQMYPGSPAWQFHNNMFEKQSSMSAVLKRYFGLEISALPLDDYLLYTQIAQAEALKYSLEHYRRRKYDCGGALFWSYNDCWGTTTGWSVIDYYLNPKPSYFRVRRALSPVLVSFREEPQGVSVWVTNDTQQEIEGELVYGLKTFRGEEVETKRAPVRVPPDGSLRLAECQPPGNAQFQAEDCFYWGRLLVDGEILSENRFFLASLEDLSVSEAALQYRLEATDGGTSLLHVRTDSYAWFVRIAAPPGVVVADNYFDVFPGEEKTIVIHGPSDTLSLIKVAATGKPAAARAGA